MTRPDGDPRQRYVYGILALLGALSVWPYLRTLGFEPMAFDDAVWISRGLWGRPDWSTWVWGTRQLGVGYRPIAALTYTLDSSLSGLSMPVFRATDLLLHIAAGVLVFSLFRRLARDIAGWASLVAAGVFLLHPATEEVVPYLARRSYGLSTVFAVGALIAFHESLREERALGRVALRASGAAILLALGVLSNETAMGVVPMAAFVMLLASAERRPGFKAWAVATAIPAVALAVVLLVRSHVVAGLGGYDATEEGTGRFLSVLLASWRDVLAFRMSFGRTPPPLPLWNVLALAVVAVYYLTRLGRAVASPGWWKRPPLFVLSFAWLAGYGVVYASLGVWFPRQAYTMLPALAISLAACLAETLREKRRRPTRLATHLLPQVLLLGLFLAHSPSIRGPNSTRIENWEGTERLLLHLRADLGRLPTPGIVHLVLPYREQQTRYNPLRPNPPHGEPPPYFIRLPSRWLSTLLEGQGVRVENLLFFEKEDPEASVTLVAPGGTPALVFPTGGSYFVQTRLGLVRRAAGPWDAVLLAPPPPPPHARSYLYVWDDRSGRVLDAPPAF